MALLAGCAGLVEDDTPSPGPIDATSIPDAVPRVEPRSRYGNPESYVVHGKRYFTLDSSRGYAARGIASWYGPKFHGRRTSSGEIFDMHTMTAAHRTLPLPTYVQVRDLSTGRQVIVRVNDRGPFHPNRVIDLSYAAAAKLGIVEGGTGTVEIRAIEPGARRVALVPEIPEPPVETEPARLYIQVGAFSDRANAERLVKRVRNLTRSTVQMTPAVNQGQTLFRVRLGPLVGVAEADRLAELLVQQGMDDMHVVID